MAGKQLPEKQVSSEMALLLVDLISDFEFEDGEKLYEKTIPVVESLASFKRGLKAMGVPVIYVNDELGNGNDRLASDLRDLEQRSEKASEILALIRPETEDHWIIKPQRSGFYGTRLGSLLLSLGVNSVVVAGVTTDICVLFTAHDAYMRGYSVNIPSDCCAAVELSHHDQALSFLNRVAKADTSPSTSGRWKQFLGEEGTSRESMDGGRLTGTGNLALLPALS